MFTTLLVQPLFNLLATIYALIPFHDFGVAIILFTLIIRFALWPVVNKQLHSQKAIQELQPELQRIRSEAKGDKQLEGRLVMELYKEREINPFASFLPLLIQLPIFLALFAVLNDAVKPGQIAQLTYDWVKHLGPIADAIKAGSFHPSLLGLVDLTKPSPILAALAGAAQFVQTKQLQPKHPSDDPQAKIMSTMTYAFPFVTFGIGLTLPSALALYWLFTSLVAILQQHIVLNRDVKEVEEAADAAAAKTAAPPAPVETGAPSTGKTGKLRLKPRNKSKGE